MAWLGFIYLCVFFGGGLWLLHFLDKKFGHRIRYNQRRQQIEAEMHRREYDRRLTEDVADEWGYNPRHHRRR
ncbi:hypothetical protein [Streptomyces adelaidensis]|uniref:hypothetical protein n=1 Tax=Streptomyces adelaidensis TaxID=2796465 RepID=UPI0019057FDE|nr:hypothetical protein [Streptomyces adelaidensis]